MNASELLAIYERVADAPDAVGKLRRLVLDLAVRGKLLPRLSGAEATVSTSTSAHENPTVPRPFEVPRQWSFAALGQVLTMVNGRAFKPTEWRQNGLPIIRIQNLNNPLASFNFCDARTIDERHTVRDGDILISWSGTPGTSFGAFIWSRGDAALNQHIFRCELKGSEYSKQFLRIAINSQLDVLIGQAQGGVGLQHVTKGTLEKLLIPRPPLTEQDRIVAKVDELMALCDKLEAARKGREAARDRLTAASLARLNAPDPDSFVAAVRFAIKVLPSLTARVEQIKQLRQAILNLAVRGFLVPQIPSDDPIKRWSGQSDLEHRPSGLNRAGAMPFEIPAGWSWVRLRAIVTGADSGWSPKTAERPRTGAKWGVLRVSAVSWGEFRGYENKELLPGVEPRLQAQVRRGDFLISRANTAELIARAVVVQEDPVNLMMSDKIVRLLLDNSVNRQFICMVNNSADYARAYYAKLSTGVSPSMKNVSRDVILDLPVPLPPLEEQNRIVEAVRSAMVRCDLLAHAMTARDIARSRLLEGVLHLASSPSEARSLKVPKWVTRNG